MLFNSFEFLFVFLPITLAAYLFLIRRGATRAAIAWLTFCSFLFYAYWYPPHLMIILGSIAFNYAVGSWLAGIDDRSRRKLVLTAAIAGDLALLAYFKYVNFFLDIIHEGVAEGRFMASLMDIALPIGISFYTFQQIAYLVDVYRDRRRYSFLDYAFFPTFFPHLIAGPILRHSDLIPQLGKVARRVSGRGYIVSFAAPGFALLAIGLFKKTILADTFGDFADLAFDSAARGNAIGFLEAWGSTIAYAWQIYFDFSAYSDMAVGLGFLFGIRLPINFNSPYQATSIIDFWRRWHMTLSRFLRDYLYIPLGGNQRGELRRYINLVATMVLGGLWHGAGFTFILWGAIHGILLALNHLSRSVISWRPPRVVAIATTLFLVILAWVPFRAPDLTVTGQFYRAMSGWDGIAVPPTYQFAVEMLGPLAAILGVHVGSVLAFGGFKQLAMLGLGLLIVLTIPNAVSVLALPATRRWAMKSRVFAVGAGAMVTASLVAMYVRENVTFLYFQF